MMIFGGYFQVKWMESLKRASKTASNEVQHAIFVVFIRLEITNFRFQGWYLHLRAVASSDVFRVRILPRCPASRFDMPPIDMPEIAPRWYAPRWSAHDLQGCRFDTQSNVMFSKDARTQLWIQGCKFDMHPWWSACIRMDEGLVSSDAVTCNWRMQGSGPRV